MERKAGKRGEKVGESEGFAAREEAKFLLGVTDIAFLDNLGW